ncbi:methyltransferase domain-containing protein [Nostoc spongiaeforme FACHB-130]|uniref:Methyltransferase domain-containing protein n=1 Tax=Nostoc spongiaeforme FACHB-130 TaxID=1357510 RepID=A0ABR8G3Q9_9NOSO|nr:methyltransferase domain-containing protein [Nostoc spongiaeforme]MBD2597856.1 methyltransferase domain-containing protein [Nostoc spongiaeforme FACHB-130]
MTKKLTQSNISECQEQFNLSYHVNFALWCEELVGFADKNVLEVGGSLPREFVFDYLHAKTWTAVESPEYEDALKGVSNISQASILRHLSNEEKVDFTENKNINGEKYAFYAANIEELPPEYYNKYDLVFSIAAFEHIHKFPTSLEKMFLSLKPGGQLFSVFSPIWSAHDGHHLPTITDSKGKSFDFQNSPIPPWGHLLMRPPELCHHLYQFTDKEAVDLMMYHVYNSGHINRFFTEDYLDFINQSSFTIKRFDPIGLCSIPEEIQQQLETLYPGRKYFANNGILVVLEKLQDSEEQIQSQFDTKTSSNQSHLCVDTESTQDKTEKSLEKVHKESDSVGASLAVCMIVQNVENTLAIALESLQNVYDELIIVDGGSTDSTCEIALRYGAKLIHSKWQGDFALQRNISLSYVTSDWVFILDADEFIDKVTLDFLQYIKTTSSKETDNFWLPRKWITPFSLKHYISSSPHYPDWQGRLFKHSKHVTYKGRIHELPQGFNSPAKGLHSLSIYHLDLLVNSESKRKQKVLKYSEITPQDGMPHFYLPNLKNVQKQVWNFNQILPVVQSLIQAIPMKCKVCESDTHIFAKSIILGQYDVDYFQCSDCGFVQTEEPYWLDEAYSDAIARTDVGLVFRNNNLSRRTAHIIVNLFNHEAKFLDYGGGYGLFVRMMRDLGFDFYWDDKFCTNLFAKGFEFDLDKHTTYELVTAFEVFEHFSNPIEEIENILKISKNILFSTEILPQNNPKPNEWWYYSPHDGQHISIYTVKSLSKIAEKYNLNLYSDGSSLHLLTEQTLPPELFNSLCHSPIEPFNKQSLLQNDYSKAVFSLISRHHNNFISVNESNEYSTKNPKILVDGVFFQLYQTGIARVWKSLLEEWTKNSFAQHLIVLDRAGTAPKFPGIRYLNITSYDYDKTDNDREILQHICDEEGVDLFISSYYTTPLITPSVFMAYDMIPEVMGWNMDNPMWQVKHEAIQHASAYIAISAYTARDLSNCFPEISVESITVAHCGVSSTFSPAQSEDVNSFKSKYGITKPYFILVGAGNGYKNGMLFFQAFSQLANSYGFDIICTGSGGILASEFRACTSGSSVYMLQLSDEELATAYSGAVALVYPSKYEGFGMPIVEAMACGCPVITCPNASIPEVAGEAAIYVKDNDVDGMVNALCDVQKPRIRQALIEAGLAQAQKFSWTKMADIVSSSLINASLLSLKLKEINVIVFPDWSQSEELLGLELESVIKAIATYPDSQKTTLLIYTSNSSTGDAELLLSGITMNLLMEEDLDISEGLEIALVGSLADIQWQALLPRLSSRIILEHEDKAVLAELPIQTILACELENFINQLCVL